MRQHRDCPCCLSPSRDAAGKQLLTAIPIEGTSGRRETSLRCHACGFEFPAAWQNWPRYHFALLGQPGAGKTRWLQSAHDLIRRAYIPSSANVSAESLFEDERSETSEGNAARFALFRQTQPSWFGFSKRDSIFIVRDWRIGQVMDHDVLMEEWRRINPHLCGVLFFLDPTRDNRYAFHAHLHEQLNALHNFCREVMLARGGRRNIDENIDIPLAICISKIDALQSSPLRETLRQELWAELRETEGREIDLPLIRRRSQIIANVVDELFADANINVLIERMFNKHEMFFPLSEFAFNETTAEQADVFEVGQRPNEHERKRFGIVEPLLWLMHKQKRQVLDGR